MIRVGGEGDIASMGTFFIVSLIIALMTPGAGKLMVGIRVYFMAVDTLPA